MEKAKLNWFAANRIHILVWILFIFYEAIIIGILYM